MKEKIEAAAALSISETERVFGEYLRDLFTEENVKEFVEEKVKSSYTGSIIVANEIKVTGPAITTESNRELYGYLSTFSLGLLGMVSLTYGEGYAFNKIIKGILEDLGFNVLSVDVRIKKDTGLFNRNDLGEFVPEFIIHF